MSEEIKNILHLEDNEDYQYYVETLLSDFVNVISVPTANEFREALSGCKYDMFILDLIISDGSGARIAKEVRAKYPDTPIVILSAHDIVNDLINDADAVFVKTTLNLKEFSTAIYKLLY